MILKKDSSKKSLYYSALIVFCIALIVRFVIIWQNHNYFYPGNDEMSYHNGAISIVTNNYNNLGLYREPGYPLFVAGVYKIWVVLGGHLNEIKSSGAITQVFPEIQFLRIIQAIIGSLIIVCFYLLLINVINKRITIVIAIISGIYLPLASQPLNIHRETVYFFIIMCFNLALWQYYKSPKVKHIIICGILWGISNLFLQLTFLFIIPYILLYFYLKRRNILLASRDFAIGVLFMGIVVSPWLYKCYSYFPDARIFKTMGCSVTLEAKAYAGAMIMYREMGNIDSNVVENDFLKNYYFISDSDKFIRSFKGYYNYRADTTLNYIKGKYNLQSRVKYYLGVLSDNFRLTMMQTFFWNPKYDQLQQQMNPIKFYYHSKRFLFSVVFIIFAYLSIIGVFIFYKKLWPILPLFAFFTSLFYFIGNESRREIIIHPFLIMFSTITLIFLYYKYVKKETYTEISKKLFIE